MSKLGYVFLLIFVITLADAHPALRTALQIGSAAKHQKKPVVVIIDPYKHYVEFLNRIRSNGAGENEKEESEEVDDAEEEAKSLFYSYLRTSESDPDLDDHKSKLRTALRTRCGKVDACQKKCPKKKPKCQSSCKEVFDSSNLCDPPKKKKKKTVKVTYEYECDDDSDECGGKRDKYRGATLPPRWRLRK